MHYNVPIYFIFQQNMAHKIKLFCTILLMKTVFQAVVTIIAARLSMPLRWMFCVMLFVRMDNVKMNLLMKMVGLMLMSSKYLSSMMRCRSTDLLKRPRTQTHLLTP